MNMMMIIILRSSSSQNRQVALHHIMSMKVAIFGPHFIIGKYLHVNNVLSWMSLLLYVCLIFCSCPVSPHIPYHYTLHCFSKKFKKYTDLFSVANIPFLGHFSDLASWHKNDMVDTYDMVPSCITFLAWQRWTNEQCTSKLSFCLASH